MAMKRREKILAAVSGSLLALLAVAFLFAGTDGAVLTVTELRRQRNVKRADLEKKQPLLRGAAKAAAKIAAWNSQALPTNLDTARSHYQNWLRALVEKHKFRDPNVYSKDGLRARGAGTVFPFNIQGRAGLGQVTRFLYDFYSAGHLHQIRWLRVTPIDDGKDLKVELVIEAMSLPTADRADALSKVKASRLKRKDADAYANVIVRRLMEGTRYVETGGLFAPYAPPVPPREPAPKETPKPKFDHLKQTILDGIVAVDGKAEAWLLVKTTGKRFTLAQGEAFEIGEVRGKIVEIRPREVVIEIDGRQQTVKQGDNLRQEQ